MIVVAESKSAICLRNYLNNSDTYHKSCSLGQLFLHIQDINMKKLLFIVSLIGFLILACNPKNVNQSFEIITAEGISGEVIKYIAFQSEHVLPRNVEVWLPPSYHTNPGQRYPVLYMHDGQNVFNPSTSYTGVDWDIDGALTKLIEEGIAREAIVVAPWNSERRTGEYMPAKPLQLSGGVEAFEAQYGQLHSDAYLKFLTSELKPFIDATYRTLTDAPNTMIMGSSMGGLISAYAIAEYPEIFGRAGCISTHWTIGGNNVVDWFNKSLPEPGSHFIYFDYGTEGVDAPYEPFQLRLNEALLQRGFAEGVDFVSYRFEGADHNETAWKERMHIPLTYLLGK